MRRKPNAPTRARVGVGADGAAIGLGLVSAALVALALGSSPAGAQDIGSDCPVFAGQTHGQIIRGVEGRLDGDWALAIKTTERSAKRLKDKGESADQAILFAQVLTCLRDEVAAGRHGDEVAAAKANPKPEPDTASNGRQAAGTSTAGEGAGGGQGVDIGRSDDTAGSAGGIDIGTSSAGSAAEPAAGGEPQPQTEPQTAAGEVLQSGGGVALPGTAESYALNDDGGNVTQPQVAAAPAGSYAGQACNYFTRPLEEVINGLRHLNRYGEGEWVCHENQMYACTNGVWEDLGSCSQYKNWEMRLSDRLEVYPR